MTTPKFIIIQEDETTFTDVVIDNKMREFYKKETGHQRVTLDGISKFFNNLFKTFQN